MSADELSAAEQIDKKIADLGDWRGERLADIRRLIHEVDPKVVEEWKYRGSPVWSHEGTLAVGNAHKDKVKLTFTNGAHLKDPGKVFNAGLGGKKWRAIDIYEGDQIDRTALKALLREAVDYNTAHSYTGRKARFRRQADFAVGRQSADRQGGRGRAGAGLHRGNAGVEAGRGAAAGRADRAHGAGGAEGGAVEFAVVWHRGPGLVRDLPRVHSVREGDVYEWGAAGSAAARTGEGPGLALDQHP